MKRQISILLATLVLSACASGTQMTMLDKPYPVVSPEHVKIIFNQKPKCNAKQLAFLNTDTEFSWSQDDAIRSARENAASVGADYLAIEKATPKYNKGTETIFHAVAYKCIKDGN